jgi:hypothetical protein
MKDRPSIELTVSDPKDVAGEPAPIQGFRFFWACYVNGYKPAKHCQSCFIGARVRDFSTPSVMSGRSVSLDRIHRYPYVYVCGVGKGPRADLWKQNLHFPLRYEEGSVAEVSTYNGYHLRAVNASRVVIPELPENWQGKDPEHTRCKNFQFAVACFGYPPSDARS